MKEKLDKWLGRFLVILMALMTIDVLWGVFTRYVVGSQASWSEELARYLMIWLALLGAAYASGQGAHLAIDLLKPRLDTKNVSRVNLLISVLVCAFSLCVLVIGGGRLMYVTHKLGQMSPALNIPKSYVYVVIPVAGILIIIYQFLRRDLITKPSTA
ncbi:MAG: TRAP transporter small permease [Saprospiraceae bacterium]|nr:TRAP transporter small permease [Saprospiraceae bacterium]